jgi:hypothetical protein
MRHLSRALFCLAVVLGTLGGIAGAQDLRPLGTDMGTLITGFGNSIMPNLQQNVLADDGVGAASIGKSRFFVALEGGATFGSPGLLAPLAQTPTPFQLIDVNGLIANFVTDPTASGYISTIKSMSYFPYPDAKVVFGVKPAFGIEIIGSFAIMPQGLTDFATGLASLGSAGIQLSTLSASLHVRKVLIEDGGALPAVSIGAGYAYTSFHAGYTLPTQTQIVSGYTLTYGGPITLDSHLNTAGVDLTLSKRFFVFTPFVQVSPWYQWASFSGTMDLSGVTLTSGGVPVAGMIPPTSPAISLSLDSLSFIVSGGVEVNLGGFALVPAGSFDLSNKNFSANLSTRFQF